MWYRISVPNCFSMNQPSPMMSWAHGHQIKAISKFALAIIDKQAGNQAELARWFHCEVQIRQHRAVQSIRE